MMPPYSVRDFFGGAVCSSGGAGAWLSGAADPVPHTFWCEQTTTLMSKVYSLSYCRRGKFVFFRPLNQWLYNTVYRQHSSVASISVLLYIRCPFAVVGFVVPFTVFSLDGVLPPRTLAHVCKEILEILPPVANGNARVVPAGSLRVSATALDHRPPRYVGDTPSPGRGDSCFLLAWHR